MSEEQHDEPNRNDPMTIYILSSGDIIARRETVKADGSQFGSTHLAHRSEMVLRVFPRIKGQEFSVKVLKFRGDIRQQLFGEEG